MSLVERLCRDIKQYFLDLTNERLCNWYVIINLLLLDSDVFPKPVVDCLNYQVPQMLVILQIVLAEDLARLIGIPTVKVDYMHNLVTCLQQVVEIYHRPSRQPRHVLLDILDALEGDSVVGLYDDQLYAVISTLFNESALSMIQQNIYSLTFYE